MDFDYCISQNKSDFISGIKQGINTYYQQTGRNPAYIAMGELLYLELLERLDLPASTKELKLFDIPIEVR